MRVAMYCRVSTRDQHPENQIIELKEYAERHGYDYEVFQEKESTRKTRPIKQDLINRLRRKEFDGVLVWRLDRWARSLSEMIMEVVNDHIRSKDYVHHGQIVWTAVGVDNPPGRHRKD